MLSIFSKFLNPNAKEISRLSEVVKKINDLESDAKKLKGKAFAKKTEEFRERLKNGETIHQILPEVFAVVREASFQSIGLRPHDTQLMAGIVLAEGKISEQKTGEGKTLSAVAPLYLHALTGKNVHLVTVNDYLARRDAGWNGPTFTLLGLTVSSNVQEGKSFVYDPNYSDSAHDDPRLKHLKPVSRKDAYLSDIVYGTNNEFGFDYLRDNRADSLEEIVQRGHYFAIVDEVDSVLIDEARTPLIISAPDTEPSDKYFRFAQLAQGLSGDTDYTIDEKTKTAALTEHGITKVEKMLGIENLYEKDFDMIHHLENALRARTLYLINKDYVVKDGQVTIVDEFTGRLMFGRRWSDGLHQAVEAKEGVKIQQESRTLATISFQNYFRLYEILSGMTGTAATEAEEFHKIYKLDVVVIPTYKSVSRKDYSDVIYKTTSAKYTALVGEVNEMRKVGRPVLIGTTSIEKNEIIAQTLKRFKIPHQVLNAKNHEAEAPIIAKAGLPGAVTVATNMAGRGVDIVLGGDRPDAPPGVDRETHEKSKAYDLWRKHHDEVVLAGGLHVIGTERHESRRIDNQLRGRSGRLGDPGSTRFYLSLEDDLMRIFGGERIASLMERLSIPEDQPIENSLISRAIEQAQVKVEGFHFDARKRVVEYDDVANQQREILYKLRRQVLEGNGLKEQIQQKLEEQVLYLVNFVFAEADSTQVNYERLLVMFLDIMPFDDSSQKALLGQITNLKTSEAISEFLLGLVRDLYAKREEQVGNETMRQIEKYSFLASIDPLWVEHLDNLDDLREGVGLRGYGQRDPIVEYKNEAFELFDKLMSDIDTNLVRRIFRIMPAGAPPIQTQGAQESREKSQAPRKKKSVGQQTLGRNDPCPCGAINPESGKPYKYKKCGLISAPWHRR